MKLKFLQLQLNATLKQRLCWYIRIRWFFLLAVIIPGVLSNAVGQGLSSQVRRDLLLGSFALLTNGLLYIVVPRLRSRRTRQFVIIALLVLDVAIITALIYTKGGIESRSPILYTIPLLIASAIFGQRGVYYCASLSIGLYNSLILCNWLDVFPSIGAVNQTLQHDSTYVLNTVTFFTSVLVIIAFLADFITRLLKEQQLAMQKSTQDMQEAQRIAKLGSWTWGIANNNIAWSDELYNIYGFDKEKYLRTFPNYLRYTHEDDKARISEGIDSAMKLGQATQFDHRFIRNGETRWFHTEVFVRKDTSGKPIELYGTTQDISDQKKAEAELHHRADELERLNAAMVGRELKMIELKEQLKARKAKV